MAVFRCNKCGHTREVSNEYAGRTVRCPKCKQSAPIHDTVAFIEKVVDQKPFRPFDIKTAIE